MRQQEYCGAVESAAEVGGAGVVVPGILPGLLLDEEIIVIWVICVIVDDGGRGEVPGKKSVKAAPEVSVTIALDTFPTTQL